MYGYFLLTAECLGSTYNLASIFQISSISEAMVMRNEGVLSKNQVGFGSRNFQNICHIKYVTFIPAY